MDDNTFNALVELTARVEALEEQVEQLRYEGPARAVLAEDDYDDLLREEYDW